MERSELSSLFHEHFRFQAARTPETVALRHGDECVTYADLDRRSERIAGALAAREIGQGSYVGVHIDRSIDYVTCILGILKANAAVVPLPSSYPRERLHGILAFSRLDLVLDRTGERLDPSGDIQPLGLEELEAEQASDISLDAGNPRQPAFVLCSSGSTGTPKMIVRSHESFFHRLEWTWREHPFTEGDVGCQKAHLTTTHSLYELFEPLLCGAPTVVIGDAQTRNLEAFWQAVRVGGVTRLLLVPSALRASLAMPDFSAPAVRVLVLMGEYLHSDLAGQALAAFPADTAIYSIYGSTEASSTLVCDVRKRFRAGEELPLGEPIAREVEALVRTVDGVVAETGERGRLYIAGRALFSEYFRDPELTAAAFTALPDRKDSVYDTRDDVYRSPAGELYFLARTDDTVKVRGFRVDLPEVERAVRSHEGVRDAAVTISDNEPGNVRLLGFYSPSSVAASAIYDTLRARLPEYMLPSVLMGVDEFPRTASAKADKARLLAEHGRIAVVPGESRSLSPTERRVAGAWAAILEHVDFGPQTSFFEAGGTSLTAFSLIHRLRTEFGLERQQLREESLYVSPTLEALSARIDAVLSGREESEQVEIPPVVTLRQATGQSREPVFLVSSAGGTLGAYEKLVKQLETDREVIGIRDPYIWGGRDPASGFLDWVGVYLDALRARQPRGPYTIVAYSSAGAFGYEMARQLLGAGEDVALLALIDPLGLATGGRSQFGWWVTNAMTAHPMVRTMTRIAGVMRRPVFPLIEKLLKSGEGQEWSISEPEFAKHIRRTRRNKGFVLRLSSLFEMNTGLPFALTDEAFRGVEADEYLDVLKERFEKVMPEFDREQLERIAFQYYVQVAAQNAYELREFDGRVLLAEPGSHYAGLTAIQLRPYVKELESSVIPLGEASPRIKEISGCFDAWQIHFRSMRDPRFVDGLARELSRALR